MQKVTLIAGLVCIKVLLLYSCQPAGRQTDPEFRYQNLLDSLSEARIDSAYRQIQQQCDSNLAHQWQAVLDSINIADTTHHL